MYDKLLEIYTEVGSACCQMVDSDDQIICNHVRAAKTLLESLMKDVLKKDREEALQACREIAEINRVAGQLRIVSDKAENKAYERDGLMADYRMAKGR